MRRRRVIGRGREPENIEREYQTNVGKPAENLPDDHPDRWQWEYQGSPDERKGLLEKLSEEPVEPPLEQDTLF